MKLRALLLAVVILGCSACSGGGSERPRFAAKNKPAPELRLKKLLNAPAAEIRGWQALKGRAVILQFWATWCEECEEAIPHLNDLAAAFADAPVAFIWVTDETEADVKEFLKSHPVKGWIAPEAGAGIFRSFRVYGRPHTVLVDKDAVVTDITVPGAVTQDAIRCLLAGAPPKRTGRASPGEAPGKAAADVLAEFYIAEAAGAGSSASYGPDRMSGTGIPLKHAFDFLFGRADKLDIKPQAARAMNGFYDIRFRFPKGRGEKLRREFFLKGLETALGLKVKELSRRAEVYILKTAPGGPLNVTEKKNPGAAGLEGGKCAVDGGSFGLLSGALSERLGEPVLDETGLRGYYAYSFDFKSGDKKVFNTELNSQLGLRLERRLRKIRVLEVSRPEP
ncbi:MAG: hypothetical protein COT18_07465 [Elusimicrobia bacterium CG08_land_8_20_14_0_20_59_10]|nr:MAG: hypothetical protein COT18_07465 [Elusimicrobia bacterium CG08_land_8_20_14_0_20_59_10]